MLDVVGSRAPFILFVCLGVVSIPRRGHDDEVLDVCFDFTGQYVATASADGKTSHLK